MKNKFSIKRILSRRGNIYLFLTLFLIGVVFIGIAFRANKFGIFEYRSAFFADKSGYYIYLPAAFIYGFNATNYPEDIDGKLGYGFIVDKKHNILFTKYPMGVAMLTLPFFLIFHLLANILGYAPTGFSELYFYMPSVAGPVYLLLGLFVLHKFLIFFTDRTASVFTLIALTFGTNLYYYAFVSSYMSHVYSFAIFSFFLFALLKYTQTQYKSKKLLIILSLCAALIFLTRPTNLLILTIVPFLNVNTGFNLKSRIIALFKFSNILIFTGVFFLTICPQLLYWKFISGNYFFYSYGEQSFLYLNNPKLLEVLFAPLNGMLLYNPIIAMFFIALFVGLLRRYKNATIVFLIVFSALYIISAWEYFYYGCSFGCRPFIEYLAVLALPFAQFIQKIKKYLRYIIAVLGLYMIYFNLSLIYGVYIYSQCFMGEYWDRPEFLVGKNAKVRLWNWHEYHNYLERSKIFPFKRHSYTWKNNFEPKFSDYFLNENSCIEKVKDPISGEYVTSTENEYSDGFKNVNASKISSYNIRHIDVSAYVKQIEIDSNAHLVCDVKLNDLNMFWSGRKVTELVKKKDEWAHIKTTFELPYIDNGALYNIYFWSPYKKKILIDDMRIVFRY